MTGRIAGVSATTDWSAWHTPYDDSGSALSRRLAIVQGYVAKRLASSAEPVRLLSPCAGDGRDVIDVLVGRLDASRVSATLVELDVDLAERARARAANAGLVDVEVRRADAGISDSYTGAVPADLVLLCGIFGNIGDVDVERLIRAMPQLCSSGATVIWTRHTRAPDLTPRIREWFAEVGVVERDFVAPEGVVFSVGVGEFRGETEPLVPGARLFSFLR